MKTSTYSLDWNLAGEESAAGWNVLAGGVVGLGGAVLLAQVAAHGLFGIAGDRLPVVMAGTSAWVYVGLALNGERLRRVLAQFTFALVLFTAAVQLMAAAPSALAPWFLAQAVWTLWVREDVGSAPAVAFWVIFNAAMSLLVLG